MSQTDNPPRPSRSFVGKVVIVTGAGAEGTYIGNGRAIALLLAESGASVVCVDRDLSMAEQTAAMVQEQAASSGSKDTAKGTAVAYQGDVTQQEDCQAAVQLALDRFGRLDMLVNNVGIIGAKGTAVETVREEWAAGLDINVTSMMLMVKYAVPAMLRNPRPDDGSGIRGAIVNMGSVAGLQGGTPSLLYPTSKGAVINMTRAMAAHHAHNGIRVTCVCPGMLYTPMMYAAGMSDEKREARKKRSLLQTEGNAWDCAGPVRFLLSDEARWMTGSVLTVDAGATCASIVADG